MKTVKKWNHGPKPTCCYCFCSMNDLIGRMLRPDFPLETILPVFPLVIDKAKMSWCPKGFLSISRRKDGPEGNEKVTNERQDPHQPLGFPSVRRICTLLMFFLHFSESTSVISPQFWEIFMSLDSHGFIFSYINLASKSRKVSTHSFWCQNTSFARSINKVRK